MEVKMKKSLKISIALVLLIPAVILISVLSRNYTYAPNAPVQLVSIADTKASANVPASAPIRFIVMADSRGSTNGVNVAAVTKTMKAIKKLKVKPSFAMVVGDLISGSKSGKTTLLQLKSFEKLATKYYPESFFFPGVGNHEVVSGKSGETSFAKVFNKFNGKSFLAGYNRSVYYFDKGNSRFFMLNSDHPGEIGKISDRQLEWLKKNINPNSKNNFFFFHEPAFPTGPHIGSSLDKYPAQRDKLWEIIDASTNPIVFTGHEHYYTRRHITMSKLVYQVTSGSFGAPLNTIFRDKKDVDVPPISQYNFCVVDINEKTIDITVYNLNGKVIDSFKVAR